MWLEVRSAEHTEEYNDAGMKKIRGDWEHAEGVKGCPPAWADYARVLNPLPQHSLPT